MGRPSKYRESLALEIAARSAEGQSLRSICEDEAMPSLRSVIRWRHEHPEFERMLALAHLDRAMLYFEDAIDIADESVADGAQAARNRTRVQARQFAAARLDPARYSERIISAHVLPADPRQPFEQMDIAEQRAIARRFSLALHLGLRATEQSQREDRPAAIEPAKPLPVQSVTAPIGRGYSAARPRIPAVQPAPAEQQQAVHINAAEQGFRYREPEAILSPHHRTGPRGR